MALKQALGAAAGPLAGAAAFVLSAAIATVLYTAYPGRTNSADAPVNVAQPEPTDQAPSQTAPAQTEPEETGATDLEGTQSKSADVIAPETAEPTSEPDVVKAPEQTDVDTATESEMTEDAQAPEDTLDAAPNPIPAEAPKEDAAEAAVPDEAPAAPEQEVVAPDTQSVSVQEPVDADTPQPMRPTFDLVRIPPDGLSTVAGLAEPNSDVLILVDGLEIARVTATARGEFVSLFSLPASSEPRQMQLAAIVDGERLFSEATVIIAPVQTPAAAQPVAQAQTPDEEAQESAEQTTAAPTPTETPTGSVAPTVLLADDEGVKVLQSAAAPSAVIIDAITYDPDGNVYASGRGTPERTIRLYLSNEPLAQTVVGRDGQWRTIMDVEAGLYTLRADMIDESGAVESRVEIPFKREDIALLAQISAEATHEDKELLESDEAPAQEAVEDGAAQAEVDVTADSTDLEPTEAGDVASPEGAVEFTSDPIEPEATPAPQRITAVTVQPGNSLWEIATEAYGEGVLYVRVFEANADQIRDPDLIYPGQVFVLPE